MGGDEGEEDHEGHEGHEKGHEESHEDEGHEEEGERHCQGQACQGICLPGTKAKTVGGMTKDKLRKNKSGKIVSKRASDRAKKNYTGKVKAWGNAVKAARKALNLKGFVPIGGKSAAGKALYAKAKSLLN